MKYVNCPTCEWTLGVPEKLSGHPVTCPKCSKVFLASTENGSDEIPAKKKREKKKKAAKKPSLRSVPLPTAISQKNAESDKPVEQETKVEQEVLAAPLKVPKRKTNNDLDAPPPKRRKGSESNRIQNSVPSPVSQEKRSVVEQQVTARIIQAAPIEPDLSDNGELPTLQLKDETKPKADVQKLKTSPVFLGLLICFSVIASGLMLFLVPQNSAQDKKLLEEARVEIRKFYAGRQDGDLQPYQIELREAQRAKDRQDEIAAYRKVMARFRAEDRNEFVGVTGSPGEDIKLQELLSILLGDGKNLQNR